MEDLREHDTVRVVVQPDNQVVYIEGVSGFIERILEEGNCLFHAIDAVGRSAGKGVVPVKCLIPDKAPWLEEAREKVSGNF